MNFRSSWLSEASVLPICSLGEQATWDERIMWDFKNSPCKCACDLNLFGGLEHDFFNFPYIGNVIIPTDELHDFSEG